MERKEGQRGAEHDNGMLRGTLSVLSSCTASSLASLISLATSLLCIHTLMFTFLKSEHVVTVLMMCISCSACRLRGTGLQMVSRRANVQMLGLYNCYNNSICTFVPPTTHVFCIECAFGGALVLISNRSPV